MPTQVDVAIVGAGPAGSAAAIMLARSGVGVVMVDKATFPRDKCCGDGLTTGALRVLEQLGASPLALPSWQQVDAAWVRSPSGRVVELPLPGGRGVYAGVVRRTELDALLVDRARDAGAVVHEGAALTGAHLRPDSIELEVDGIGTLAARLAIGADGMWSPLRKMVAGSEPGYLGEWHAFRQYFGNVAPAASTQLWIWFEPDLLPGYAWSFPLGGDRANVGFGVPRGGAVPTQAMKPLWPDLLARPHIRDVLGTGAVAEAPHKAWPIPARIGSLPLSSERALFVGDAAGATDRLTGEGIGQALLTGVLAAEAVFARGLVDPQAVAATYETAVRRELVADHRMSVALGRVLASVSGARGAIRIAGTSDWTRRNFARWLFEDEPRAVVFTPRRWHRRFLDRDGAFAAAAG